MYVGPSDDGSSDGLFISDLNGSIRKLLADGDPCIVTVLQRSPDGNWVIVSSHDRDTNKHQNPILVLIQVDSCQIIALPDLRGYVASWLLLKRRFLLH